MSESHQQTISGLPEKCGQNYITLLVRDPHWLYVYWDISEDKKKMFLSEFGSELIDKSVPVLKVTNISKNESFYVRINNFSNNWYVNVDDPNCIYVVEIGLRIAENFFISMLDSNSIITPGETVSSETNRFFINYNDLRQGRLEMNKCGTIIQNSTFDGYPGISSLEFAGKTANEVDFAGSSAQFYGIY